MFSSILQSLRVFVVTRYDEFASADQIYANETCFHAPMKNKITEFYSNVVKSDVEVLIDEVHGKDCGDPEEVATSVTEIKGDKGASGAKFNAMKTDERIKVCTTVQSYDESLQ